MGNFFNMDNGFFTVLSKICDIIFLSVIWAILCIPIITIGPANTAMYYATVKVIRKERGYLFREFFKSFRLNFKRGAIIGLVLTLITAIMIFNLIVTWGAIDGSNKSSMFFGVYVAISFVVLCFSIYVFPILSRFDMTIKQLIKAASFMSMKHLLSTLGMAIVTVATVIAILFLPILIFILPATSVLINSLLMERVLKKYLPKPVVQEGEAPIKDEWYLS